jgi:plastocyanin
MVFSPQFLSIKTADTITWNNTIEVAEPHTITFTMDKNYFPPLAAPLANQSQVYLILFFNIQTSNHG